MKPSAEGTNLFARTLHRMCFFLCAASYRPWVDAMFAETRAIDGSMAGAIWVLGTFGLVARSITERVAGLISNRFSLATLTAFAGMLLCSAVSRSGNAGPDALDDACGPLAVAFAFVFVALGIFTFSRLLIHTESNRTLGGGSS